MYVIKFDHQLEKFNSFVKPDVLLIVHDECKIGHAIGQYIGQTENPLLKKLDHEIR
jgi:hypothetical protein